MSESRAVESIGFAIVYRSLADLAEDQRGHVAQGRMVVAWSEASPAVGTRAELRLSVPGGGIFELSGAVSRVAEGRGFAVDLAPESKSASHQLEQLVGSQPFQQALKVESPSSRNSRQVTRMAARVPPAATVTARPQPGMAPALGTAPPRIPPATTASGRAPGGMPSAVRASGEPSRAETSRSADSVARIEPPASRIPGAPTVSGRMPEATRAAVDPPRAPVAPLPPAVTASGRMPGALPAPTGQAPAGATIAGSLAPGSTQAGATIAGSLSPSGFGGAAAPPPAGVAAVPPTSRPAPAALASDLSLDDDDSDEPVDRYDDYDDDELYGEDDGEGGAIASDEDEPQPPTNFRTPAPGEKYVVYIVKVKTVMDLAELVPDFRQTAKLTIPARGDTGKEGDLAQLRLTLPGRNIFTMWALVGRIRPTDVTVHVNPESTVFAKALAFPKSVLGARRLTTEKAEERGPLEVIRLEEERPREDEKDMPVRRRLSRMSMEDKINMALSGSREERMALAMDGNKAIHHYLLKNARISLDEVAFIARLPTMNPDVLGKIAENPSYTQNQTVVKNLVYNPKTPIPMAIKLLDRLPRSEVMNLSKRMSMNARLVQAAKKKIEGPSR